MDTNRSGPFTFHLTSREWLDSQNPSAGYLPEGFEHEGFIHCTDGAAALAASGNRHLAGDPREHVIVVIDVSRIESEVKYEDEHRIYPHIYGPLNRDAIVDVRPAPRDKDGTFLVPDLADYE